ncbi:MAG: hypothetical protein IGS23_12860 [Rivularia sp. T60_A2020_040]|nr:hypothetical protein [Rivularia sp. T60_A2020_040]
MLQTKLICAVSLITLIGCTTQTPSSYSNDSAITPAAQSEPSRLEQIEVNRATQQENQRQIISSKIKQIEQQSELLSQTMIGRQQKISQLRLRENELESSIQTYNQKIQSFIFQNKDAVACMGAANVSLNENNQYSEDVKNVASAVTLVCAGGILLDEQFRNRVIFVADQLVLADNNTKNLTNNFQTVRLQIESEQQLLAQEQSQANELAANIRDYQSQLASPFQTEI